MKRLFHIAWMCLAVAACSKDELPGTHGEFASLTLSVASSQNDVKTRAVSADADEQRINNLYIFIFNPDGSVDCRNYISSLSASSWTGTIGGPDVRARGKSSGRHCQYGQYGRRHYPRDARRHRLACGVGFVRGEPPGQVNRTGHQLPVTASPRMSPSRPAVPSRLPCR